MKRALSLLLLFGLCGCDVGESSLPGDATNVIQHGHGWATWDLTVNGKTYSFMSNNPMASDEHLRTILIDSHPVQAEAR